MILGTPDTVYGLAIQGGGAKGTYAVGVIDALLGERLESERLPWDVVGGTSIGAYIAAMLAGGTCGHVTILRNAFLSLPQPYRKPRAWQARLLPWWKSDTPSLWDATPAMATLERYITPAHVACWRAGGMRLVVPALDLVSLDLVYMPDVVDAEGLRRWVYGSGAFPVLFQPLRHRGMLLTDAGVVETTPSRGVLRALKDVAETRRAKRLVLLQILHTSTSDVERSMPRSIIDLGKRLVSGAMREIARNDLDRIGERNVAAAVGCPYREVEVWTVEPSRSLGDSLDFSPAVLRSRYELGKQDAARIVRSV